MIAPSVQQPGRLDNSASSRMVDGPRRWLTDRMQTLTADTLTAELADLPGWVGSTTLIEREFTAPDFATGIQLVVYAGEEAEQLEHHPDIDIRWVRVRFALSTHSAGGVTALDIELARRISAHADALGCS